MGRSARKETKSYVVRGNQPISHPPSFDGAIVPRMDIPGRERLRDTFMWKKQRRLPEKATRLVENRPPVVPVFQVHGTEVQIR